MRHDVFPTRLNSHFLDYPDHHLRLAEVAGLHCCETSPGVYDHDFKVAEVGAIGPDEIYGLVCTRCGYEDPEPFDGYCDYD